MVLAVVAGALWRRRRPVERVAGHAYAIPSGSDRIIVEVLNATPRQGLARVAARVLRREGLDVVFLGNAEGEMDSTRVIVRRGAKDRAEKVRDVLGVGTVRVQLDTLRRVDVTVMLGDDYVAPKELHP